MVVNLIFSNIGDSEIIENSIPILGLVSISSYTDDVSGTTSTRYFDKFFQFTIDGINWSEWITLNNSNLNAVIPKGNHLFRIKYKYIRSGTDISGDLILNSITLNCIYQGINQPINFNSLCFGKYFEYFNLGSLNWGNNVLEKIFKRGLLAKFLERSKNEDWSDEDFIDFWWSIIYSFALIVNYGRELEKVLFDKKLLREFLKQRGLYLASDRDLIELTYLASNFYDQIRKRGTKEIFKTKLQNDSPVDGELLRLVDHNEFQEFIFSLLDPSRSGFVVNRSSPEYKSLFGITNVIKGYESTKDFVDINKYPIYIYRGSIQSDFFFNRSVKSLLVTGIAPSQVGGMWSEDFNDDYSITIDPDLDYEITFFIRKVDDSPTTIVDFGVNTYDKYGNFISPKIAHDQVTDDTKFVSITKLGDHDNPDNFYNYYLVRGIIYHRSKDEITEEQSKLNIGSGQSLVFKNEMCKMIPYLKVVNTASSGNTGNVYFWDFKVRPLKTKTARCYLNTNNVFVMFAKNLSKEYTSEKIEDIMRNYLIPYNSSLINNWIGE